MEKEPATQENITYTTQGVSRITGLAEHTIKYLIRLGLTEPKKEWLRHAFVRVYNNDDLTIFIKAQIFLQSGFTANQAIDTIKNLPEGINETVQWAKQKGLKHLLVSRSFAKKLGFKG